MSITSSARTLRSTISRQRSFGGSGPLRLPQGVVPRRSDLPQGNPAGSLRSALTQVRLRREQSDQAGEAKNKVELRNFVYSTGRI